MPEAGMAGSGGADGSAGSGGASPDAGPGTGGRAPSLTDRLWPLIRRASEAHAAVYRGSGGRLGRRFPGAPPILLLHHVGARTAISRTTPLGYVEDGEDLVLVASKGGYPRDPDWFHNLVANPDTTIQIGPEVRAVRARVAGPADRDRLWPAIVAAYGGYEGYQQRTERQIPLVILHPRTPGPGDERPGERRVGRASALPPGRVTGAGRWAVGNADGAFFAVSRRCRHLFADLSRGRIDKRDGCLVCPWHGAKYDVATGRMVRGPQAGFEKVPGLDASYEALTHVVPLARREVVERGGILFVREDRTEGVEG
jgi:deazaflavin-dependent oxidoreductase (nitroreductase family)